MRVGYDKGGYDKGFYGRVILYENLLHKCLSFKVKESVLIYWINNNENCNLRTVVQ